MRITANLEIVRVGEILAFFGASHIVPSILFNISCPPTEYMYMYLPMSTLGISVSFPSFRYSTLPLATYHSSSGGQKRRNHFHISN